jgi:hypothetical protein
MQEHRATFYFPYWNIPLSDVLVPRLREFKASMAVVDAQLDDLIRMAVNTKQEGDIEALQVWPGLGRLPAAPAAAASAPSDTVYAQKVNAALSPSHACGSGSASYACVARFD